jgi:leucyl aminopeptidase
LFLRRFIKRTKALAHVDIHASTPKAKPGRPEGAEVLAARLLYDFIEGRFGARYTV